MEDNSANNYTIDKSCRSSLSYQYRENLLHALEHEISELRHYPSPYALRLTDNPSKSSQGDDIVEGKNSLDTPDRLERMSHMRKRLTAESLQDIAEIEDVRKHEKLSSKASELYHIISVSYLTFLFIILVMVASRLSPRIG